MEGRRRGLHSVKAQHLIPQLAAAGRRFDIVYADPPYHARYCGAPLLLGLIEALGESPLFNDEGLLFVQHQIDLEVPEQSGHLALTEQRPTATPPSASIGSPDSMKITHVEAIPVRVPQAAAVPKQPRHAPSL